MALGAASRCSRKRLDRRMEEYERKEAPRAIRGIGQEPMPNGPMRQGNIDRGEVSRYDGNWKYNDATSGIESGLTPEKAQEIVKTPKGKRPDPTTYLNKEYIDAHLSQFNDGISIIMPKDIYDTIVKKSPFIGILADGTQFVLPKKMCDEIGRKANGKISVYEKALGHDIGHYSNRGGLVRIDIENVDGLNLRIPSGNEAGANAHWIPGGKTDGGIPEAVTDLIKNDPSRVKITELK